MKHLAPIGLLVLSACSAAVHRETASRNGEVSTIVFHFQTGFDGTPVSLYVEDELVLQDVLTTDDRVGVARKVSWTSTSTGRLKGLVEMDHAAPTSFFIDARQGLYVGFSRDLDNGKLRIDQRIEPFAYD